MVSMCVRSAVSVGVLAAVLSASAPVYASGVNIIYPPKLEQPAGQPAKRAMQPIVKDRGPEVTVIVIDRSFFHRRERKRAIRRAFGHRYLGFTKMYSGPRYPF